MSEIQILNNGDSLYSFRTKINENFALLKKSGGSGISAKFGVSEGNVTDGIADLLLASENTLSFKVGGDFVNLVATSGNGENYNLSYIPEINIEGYKDGEYTVVIDKSSSNLSTANFYSQLNEPEGVKAGDVWFNGQNSVQFESTKPEVKQISTSQSGLRCMANIGDFYVCAGSNNIGTYSEDGGQTWQNITLDTGDYQKTFVGCEVYEDKIYLVTMDGTVRYVDTSKQIYYAPQVTTDVTVMKFKKINEFYIAVTNKGLYITTNMTTWALRDVTGSTLIRDITFAGDKYYCINGSGVIYSSVNLNSWDNITATFTNGSCLEGLGDDNLLIGSNDGIVYNLPISSRNTTTTPMPIAGTINDIRVFEDGSIFIAGGSCFYTKDLTDIDVLVNSGMTHTYIHDKFVVTNSGIIFEILGQGEWNTYNYIPIGEIVITNGQIVYAVTYPYNSNGLVEATTSTFGLTRVATPDDEIDCSCDNASITPANLYKLQNYRLVNTEYSVGDTVGCPYSHDLQLKCTEAGTTSLEALNIAQIVNGEQIIDGSVVWQVEQVGGGAGLEIGDIGIAPLGVDESLGKRRYLNGSAIMQEQYPIFTEIVKTAIQTYAGLGCTEEEWQNISAKSVGGQCGKFVVDDEAGTIRLPKIIMPIQGLTDLTKLGEIVEAGLPDHTHYIETAQGTYLVYGGNMSFYNSKSLNETGPASATNPTYGNSDTVQQEQIQYPYFIQVATGASVQENITNEVELNNPFVLLEGEYFTAPVYNSSWLQSNEGFTGSLALHPTAYNALLVEYNSDVEVGTTVENYTKRGLSVKLNTEDYTDYDFVLNTTSQTFRCPLKINKASSRAVAGNGKAIGWTDGTTEYVIGNVDHASNSYMFLFNGIGSNVGDVVSGTADQTGAHYAMGITTDPTKSGIELSDSDLYLYFYVGETVQNANLVNVGRVEEKLSNCLTRNEKEEIISWGMPDTNAGIIQVVNQEYIATIPGAIYASGDTQSAGVLGEVLVNGQTVGRIIPGDSKGHSSSAYILVDTNDVYQFNSSTIKNPVLIFYPLKGAK